VSTLAICIVFVPVVLLTGPAKFLFTPMALAVVVAVLASYLLSRTIIRPSYGICWPRSWPSMRRTRDRRPHRRTCSAASRTPSRTASSASGCAIARHWRGRWRIGLWVCVVFGGVLASAAVLLPFVGQDFFPSVDAGQLGCT